MTIFFGRNPNTRTAFPMHMVDSHAGTHLVPPAYALPPRELAPRDYAPQVQEWLAEYEKTYGPRGTSDIPTEKVSLAQTCGPAPGPEAIQYLAKKGIRGVATDAPNLGGVEPKRALWTYWALGTNGMVGIEFLTNLERLPSNAYFLFAAGKIRGCHGGPGRAI